MIFPRSIRPVLRLSRRSTLLLSVGLHLLLPVAMTYAQPIVVNPLEEGTEKYFGVYLPTDRMITRAMDRARERIDGHEYHQALAFLHEILERDEDAFLEDSSQPDQLQGLKSTARRWIEQLPSEGRDSYELLNAAAAARELGAALEQGNREVLAQVVRRYFFTPAGHEAALILAHMETDRGQPLAAAQLYDQLLADPRAVAAMEPELSVLAAMSWAAAGHPERARAVLASVAEQFAGSPLKIADREVQLPNANSDMLAWLYDSVGRPQQLDISADNWITHRGSPARNAHSQGGAPHLRSRWQTRVVNDPRFEDYLSARAASFAQRGVVALAAARPIAVGDVVLMRTPDNVVAIDWKTGKRVWETREERQSQRDEILAELGASVQEIEPSQIVTPLEEQVWDDMLSMSLSSDGERVFSVSRPSLDVSQGEIPWQIAQALGQRLVIGQPITSRLAAFELATEGKLVWEIDGQRSIGDLEGVFFLGAPLAVHDTLFVLAEIRSAAYLLAIDPASGKLQWRQQLAGLEQSIAVDPERRLVGATPTYAEGILVCPTAAGVIVAIDIAKREFAWVYRYPLRNSSNLQVQNWSRQMQHQQLRENDRWLDGSAVISGNRVFITPPESGDLHCVDLHSGKPQWVHPRDDALLVGAVDDDVVLLIGSRSLRAVNVEDGSQAWSEEPLSLPEDAVPAGQGYLSDGLYFLPLSNGSVVAIDMARGQVVETVTAGGGMKLGNFICHRGAVLSQSTLTLDKFEQIEVLRQHAEAALAKNPNDATALRELAEMKRGEGDLPGALAMLKRAFAEAPAEPLTRAMLAECLLEALAADYELYRDDLDLVRQVVQDRDQEIELLRIEALGLHTVGRRTEALEAYLQLANILGDEPKKLAIGPNYSIRSDRWIRGRLSALWSESSSAQRRMITERLAEERQWPSGRANVVQLRHYLRNFGGLPGTDEVRLALARRLVENQREQEAEIQLLELSRSAVAEYRAAADVLMAILLEDTGRHEEYSRYAALVADRWYDVVALDGMTGGQWLEKIGSQRAGMNQDAWPNGRVLVDLTKLTGPQSVAMVNQIRRERQTRLKQLRIEQVTGADLGLQQWFVSDDCRQFIGRNAAGEDRFRLDFGRDSLAKKLRIPSACVEGAQLGHLLVVSLGCQIVTLDTRHVIGDGDGSILWQAFPIGQFPLVLRNRARHQSNVYHPWSDRRRYSSAAGEVTGSLGPVTPDGIVFQVQDELLCVDPLTGEVLWTRSDVPSGCELFGDGQTVLAADVEEEELYIFDMTDGSLLERRRLPAAPWIMTVGPNIASLSYSANRRMTLKIVNVGTGDELFAAECESRTKMSVIEPGAIAVVEPSGHFRLVDARTGRVLVDQPLESISSLQGIETLVSGDSLFLMIHQGGGSQHASIGGDYPLVSGQVYAFDLVTGEPLWPAPATVENRGIALVQPQDIPLLVFVDREVRRDAGGGRPELRLLCLDKRNGRSVYRNDQLTDTARGHFRILSEQGSNPSVTLEMSSRIVRLTLTDQPRPPEPPANEEIEAPRATTAGGLWEVGRRMGNIIQDALQNPNDDGPALPGADLNQNQNNAIEPVHDD